MKDYRSNKEIRAHQLLFARLSRSRKQFLSNLKKKKMQAEICLIYCSAIISMKKKMSMSTIDDKFGMRFIHEFMAIKLRWLLDTSCGGGFMWRHYTRSTDGKQAISDGGRVLWASPEMPDATRFSQIFSDISLTESSRFHAMNLVGNVDQALDSLRKTATALPNVSLVILDDYCPESGRYQDDVVMP